MGWDQFIYFYALCILRLFVQHSLYKINVWTIYFNRWNIGFQNVPATVQINWMNNHMTHTVVVRIVLISMQLMVPSKLF